MKKHNNFFSGPARIVLVFLIGLTSMHLSAQVQNPAMPDTSFGEKVEYLRIGGYMDLYYGSFQPNSKDGSIPYLVSMNQNRQISVNLAYLDLRYAKGRIRSRLIPGFGTYMNANYQGEPGGLAYLVEANAGYCLNPKRQIWLDVGVLSSPYSNESCISKDHLMYSRSLAPEYVPYYLSGIKCSAPIRTNLSLSLYLINGWQQIRDRNLRRLRKSHHFPKIFVRLEFSLTPRHRHGNGFCHHRQKRRAPLQ